jgi:hypothetical protein
MFCPLKGRDLLAFPPTKKENMFRGLFKLFLINRLLGGRGGRGGCGAGGGIGCIGLLVILAVLYFLFW